MNTAQAQQISLSSASTYVFVPSTAAASVSSLLYLTEVYSECLQSYTTQMQNEMDAQLSFAKSAADELEKQGADELESAILNGSGSILNGACQMGAASAMQDVPMESAPEEESPVVNKGDMNVEDEGIEMTTFKNGATDEEIEENSEALKTKNEQEEDNKRKQASEKQNTRAMDSKGSYAFKGLGEALNGAFQGAAGIPQYEEKLHQGAEKLDEFGQSSAKMMSDQFMQQYNSIVSSLNQVYSSLVQIAQANNSR